MTTSMEPNNLNRSQDDRASPVERSYLDLNAQEFLANPYPYFHHLREVDPVHWHETFGAWLLTRYADVERFLGDPRFGRGDLFRTDQAEDGRLSPLDEIRYHWMLYKDPPEHTRLRQLVIRAFTPRTVKSLRPTIKAIATELLDQAQARGAVDLISEFAYPLPLTVIARLLGVPAHDVNLFRQFAHKLSALVELKRTPEDYARGNELAEELSDYFRRLVARKQGEPANDLISELIVVEEEGQMLTEPELIGTCILLLFGGHETTVNLIGNGTLALLGHPKQWRLLQRHPELIPTAVEELLRYDSPVSTASRVAFEEIEIGGKTIHKGQKVIGVLLAANRDPARFQNPDRLDVTRDESPPLSFAYGIHYCLGAPLARLEGAIAFESLIRRRPTLTVALDQLTWRQSFSLRGLTALPLQF